jgi:type IV secretory pathway TrbD component
LKVKRKVEEEKSVSAWAAEDRRAIVKRRVMVGCPREWVFVCVLIASRVGVHQQDREVRWRDATGSGKGGIPN